MISVENVKASSLDAEAREHYAVNNGPQNAEQQIMTFYETIKFGLF